VRHWPAAQPGSARRRRAVPVDHTVHGTGQRQPDSEVIRDTDTRAHQCHSATCRALQ